jgi:hypothetical protein
MEGSVLSGQASKVATLPKVNPPKNALRHSYASYWLACSSKEGLGELSKKFVQRESGSLILQPRRKRSIVVIDPAICIPSTPPFVDSEAVRQGIRTRGGWVSPESPVFLEPRRAQIER